MVDVKIVNKLTRNFKSMIATTVTFVGNAIIVFDLFDLDISKNIIIKVTAFVLTSGIAFRVINSYIKLVQENRMLDMSIHNMSSNNLSYVDLQTEIRTLTENKKIEELHILASGTETYYSTICKLIQNGSFTNRAILHIHFRIGTSQKRYSKLEEYGEKWLLLANNNNLIIYFYPILDFKLSFRGVIINKENALIGFYVRKNNTGIGSSKQVINASKKSPIGNYIIETCLQLFDSHESYSSIDECIEILTERTFEEVR